MKPLKVQDDGMNLFLLETEKPLFLTEWAEGMAAKEVKEKEINLWWGSVLILWDLVSFRASICMIRRQYS